MLDSYLKNLFKTAQAGDAREESFYFAIKSLFEEWASQNKRECSVVTLPRKTEAGNPDFRVREGKSEIVGYIEAKTFESDLNKIEKSEQLKRYRETFPNLILTNFFEFRLYRNGELVLKTSIGRPLMHELKMPSHPEHEKEFLSLLEQFFSFSVPETKTAKQLAIELAKRTRFLRDEVIAAELEEEKTEGTQTLEQFYGAFQKHLIPSLTHQGFSDLFAQTVTYGLFAARSRADNGFNRRLAYEYIPHTVGILRDVFRFISSADLPQQMEWIVDDIAEVLAKSNVKKIMHDFYLEGKGRDPVVHFYETFLAEYDPKEREKRGVYYTPEPVVSYITRSVHQLLKDKFGKEDGFATQSVTVLDPAAGTLTFPMLAIEQAVEEYKAKYGAGGVKGLIKDHILKNFYAFELMMASYAIGHVKAGFILEEYDYRLSKDERFKLYLTNTLDFTKEDPANLPGFFEQKIAEESREALKVKEEIPIMVVMGNPPYSGISENKGKWILEQIEEYKKVDGKPLGERKHWLQDDYVKFMRFAQWKIERNGQGVLGFITNHAWLDNPTFRGMRASLLSTFDEIYILNLRGSSLKGEKTPKGGKDENVFDIRAGVAITIGVKLSKPALQKKVFYADQWGLREEKYAWLDKNSVQSTKWQKLEPASPSYIFVPQQNEGREEYESFPRIDEIFPVNSTGIVTARDAFATDFAKESLKQKINVFRNLSNPDDFIKEFLRGVLGRKQIEDVENYAWRVSQARKQLQETKNWEDYFSKVLYRPFDERWIYYHPSVVWRTRDEVMKHMIKSNLGLICTRSNRQASLNYFFTTEGITDFHVLDNARDSTSVFPLYLYNNEEQGQQDMFQVAAKVGEKEPNINPEIFDKLKKAFGKKPSPEEIFYYIYAVFYSNVYREKYKEFLKRDFPRVPFTKDYKLFSQLADLGKQLVDLHLLKAAELQKPMAKFEGVGEAKVEKLRYEEKVKRVYISEAQYFEGIAPEVWNYYIGGYQVLNKWLKDRKDRRLSAQDIKHYIRIATALSQTIEVQNQIDKLYPKIEKGLVESSLS